MRKPTINIAHILVTLTRIKRYHSSILFKKTRTHAHTSPLSMFVLYLCLTKAQRYKLLKWACFSYSTRYFNYLPRYPYCHLLPQREREVKKRDKSTSKCSFKFHTGWSLMITATPTAIVTVRNMVAFKQPCPRENLPKIALQCLSASFNNASRSSPLVIAFSFYIDNYYVNQYYANSIVTIKKA